MRADAPVLVAGVASFPRVEAEKRPRALCPVGVINYCLSQGKYGDNLRAVVMHNDEEQPHLHFSYAPIPKLMPRHYITDTRQKKNFIAASKAFQDDYHAQVAIHCGMARLGPKKQRLTRAEWKAQKKHAMKVAAAECGARFRCDQGEGGA